ncbi:MAG: SHOCT domain-containing protein [Pseudomonadota bacterium]
MLSLPSPCGSKPRPFRLLAPQIIALATFFALTFGPASHARDPDVFYKDGAYSTFTLADQDTDRYGLNEHPVELSPDDLKPILQAITVRADGLFSNNELETLFSPQQATLLAGQIAKGLQLAGPDQDVTFVMQRRSRRLVLLSGLALTSGRIFFADGKLNIIIGELDRQRNREFERLFDTTGAVQPYALSSGTRKRNSGALKGQLLAYEGLSNQVTSKGKVRTDWILIDVPLALDSLEAQPSLATAGSNGASGAPAAVPAPAPSAGMTSEEAAALQAEQEAMRAEMSRMREQLEAAPSGSSTPAAVPAAATAAPSAPLRVPGTNIEERLRLLIDLYQQGLITEAEYNDKRRQILSEL